MSGRVVKGQANNLLLVEMYSSYEAGALVKGVATGPSWSIVVQGLYVQVRRDKSTPTFLLP